MVNKTCIMQGMLVMPLDKTSGNLKSEKKSLRGPKKIIFFYFFYFSYFFLFFLFFLIFLLFFLFFVSFSYFVLFNFMLGHDHVKV